jgi:hypothetical protein
MFKYLLLFIIINSIVAMYVHSKSSNIVFSAVITAPVASILLFAIDYYLLGFVDPFAIFGFFFSIIYGFLFSLIFLLCYKFIVEKLLNRRNH